MHSKAIQAVFTASVVALAAACGPKASKEDCDKTFDKMVEVELKGQSPDVAKLTRSMMEGERANFGKECVGKISKKDADCAALAKSKSELDACGKF